MFQFKGGAGGSPNSHDTNLATDFARMQEQLFLFGLYMRDVRGDGNCLFRSVSDQLEDNEDNHNKYRQLAVSYLYRKKKFCLFLT